MPVAPAVIAGVGLAVAIAGTAASVAAAHQQAQNQQQAANYNAQVSANDAQVAVWQRQQQQQEFAANALMTQEQGAQNASRLEMQNGAITARNVAAAAASGLDLTGSTASVISGSAANNELAVLNDQHKTQIAAYENLIGAQNATYNSTIQANRYSAQSKLFSMESTQAGQTGFFSELGAGAAGAARITTAANSANSSGLFGPNAQNNMNDIYD